jgi:hypothetical protein
MHYVIGKEGAYDCGFCTRALHEAAFGASCLPSILSNHLALIARSPPTYDGSG